MATLAPVRGVIIRDLAALSGVGQVSDGQTVGETQSAAGGTNQAVDILGYFRRLSWR